MKVFNTPESVRIEAVERYMAGETCKSLGIEYGVSNSTVFMWARQMGLVRHNGRRTREHYQLTEIEITTLIDAYQNGMSSIKAARLVNCTGGACINILRARGIAIRSRATARREYPVNDAFFSRMDNEQAWWLLGLLMTDGNVHSDCNKISLQLQRGDREILEVVRTMIKTDGPITERKNRAMSQLAWCSKQMKDDLVQLGCTPRKSLTLTAPSVPRKFERHFWRGAMDGDGFYYLHTSHARPRGNWIVGLCGTISMVTAFREFALRFIATDANVIHTTSGIYEFKCGKLAENAILASELYRDATVFLRRKKLLADEIIHHLYACPPRKILTHVTREELLHLYKELGTWRAVGKALGATAVTSLRYLRQKHGLI